MALNKTLYIRSSQDCDFGFSRDPSPHGNAGYLFYRSNDSLSHMVDSQDYLVFRDDIDKFCFVVCDGVGQSYFGQLAAEFLGEHIFDWLNQQNTQIFCDPDRELECAQVLSDFLDTLKSEAQEIVTQHPLPSNLPDLQKIALDEQKNYGSETVFLAGRVDFSNGRNRLSPVLNVFWLGDVQFHMYNVKGKELDFPGKWTNAERWSTKRGIRGTSVINHYTCPLVNVSKIVAHSDGIKSYADQLFTLTNNPNEMDLVIRKLRSSPESDDISLIVFDFSKHQSGLKKFFRRYLFKVRILWRF